MSQINHHLISIQGEDGNHQMCIISCSFLALQFINIFNLQSICQSSLFMADYLCVASLYFFSYSIKERSTFWNKLDSYLQLCTLPKVNIYAVDILPIQIGFALKRGLANVKRIIFIVMIFKLCYKAKRATQFGQLLLVYFLYLMSQKGYYK